MLALVPLVGLLVASAACTGSDTKEQLPVTGQVTGTTRADTTGTTAGGTTGTTARGGASASGVAVFNGQGNDLDAYEPEPPFRTQKVVTTRAKDPNGLDINAQLCFFPDGSGRMIAGEDTGQTKGDRQGWGIFHLTGSGVGSFAVQEVGKLVPTYQSAEDNAENYGCGFLRDGRVLTTDVGNQALGPADGQLIVWFGPFDTKQVPYCKLDVDIATAQSIWVDDQDRIYVASARPSDEPNATSAGVWRYDPPFPTGPDAAGGCGRKDDTGAPLADSVHKTRVIAAGEHGLLSPAGLAPAPNGGLYVSSVITGVIDEYATDGTFRRTILQPPAGETLGERPYSTGTPLGIAVGPDGTLYYADIGVVVGPKGPGPGDQTGSLRRITFRDGQPQPPETMATGLDFPDGVGVWTRPADG